MANKQLANKFARLIDETGLTSRQVARHVNCNHQTLGNWRNALRAIPPEIFGWIEAVADFMRKNPPPDFRTLRDPAGGGRPRADGE
jgi:hypothetical protein